MGHSENNLATALEHFHAGDFEKTKTICQQLLTGTPHDSDTLMLLGLAYHRTGGNDIACQHLSKATIFNPNNALAHFNYGVVLQQQNKLDEAVQSFRAALALNHDLADVHFNLGNALFSIGRLEDAVTSYHMAALLKPDHGPAYHNLGMAYKNRNMLREALICFQKALALDPHDIEALYTHGVLSQALGRREQAIDSYQKALAINPGAPMVHYNLGIAFHEGGLVTEAIKHFRAALAFLPDDPSILNNLGLSLQENRQSEEALSIFEKIVVIKPDHHEAHLNIGNILREREQFDDAAAAYQKSVASSPEFAKAHYNLGKCLQEQNKLPEAIKAYRQAISLDPAMAEAHWNLSHTLLLNGELEEGFKEYAWRFKKKAAPVRLACPLWQGEAAPQGTILVYTEQGLGDNIQFVRYAAMVKQRAGKVILACAETLADLFKDVQGIDETVPLKEIAGIEDKVDYHVPLLTLPTIFKTSITSIPQEFPYLTPSQARTTELAALFLSSADMVKVGLVWRGNPAHENDRQRSCRLEQFQSILHLPGFAFFSLQKDGAEASRFPQITDLSSCLTTFADTAACIAHLDLVLSVDTSVAHLSGAMGKPTWTLLPFVPDWRWMLGRDDTPWYPAMRLFRQQKRGDWQEVLNTVASELLKTQSYSL